MQHQHRLAHGRSGTRFGITRYGCASRRAKATAMSLELNQARWNHALGRASQCLVSLLLSAIVAAGASAAMGSSLADDQTAAQQQPFPENQQAGEKPEADQNSEPSLIAPAAAPDSPSAPSTKAGSLCEALATAATSNDLPVDFFIRLIWQESRFRPDAISRAGAQGVAQFMPATARLRGLENPFNAFEAIAKSASLLRDLNREFGNLGLAAAAYSAGSGRVRDWLARRRPLPGETRAYVRLVTGRPVEEWTGNQPNPVEMPRMDVVPCNLAAAALVQPGNAPAPKAEIIKPWGVEVVGGPTPAKALIRYHEWLARYAGIVGDREPHVVIRGILGNMGAARVRVGEDSQAAAAKLCAALKKAGTYCDVLRN